MEESLPVDLKEFLNKKVTVQVKGGRTLRGTLKQFDDYMNLLLENVEERRDERVVAHHKTVLAKGGNVCAVTL